MKCPSCSGSRLVERNEVLKETIAGVRFIAEVPVRVCASCGERLYRGEGLAGFERAVARRLAEHGPVTGEAFRFMRKVAGLRAKDAAELLDVTDVTISRWENGAPVDRNAFLTLGSLLLDRLDGRDTTKQRLRQLREGSAGEARLAL